MWVVFPLLIVLFVILDLRGIGKREMSPKEALLRTGFWIFLALIFNVIIYLRHGREIALEFSSAYLIEYSMSIDNIFGFYLIFQSFQILPQHQPKVLFWGIIGAMVFRLLFIILGIWVISKYQFFLYIFGFILLTAAARLLIRKKPIGDRFLIKIAKKFFPLVDSQSGNFFEKVDGKIWMTPLFVALCALEGCDIIFSFDSIDAVFGATLDPFIVFSSNACAIVGLRSMYFAIGHLFSHFSYIRYAVCAILFFLGVKMVGSFYFTISPVMSLLVIATIVVTSIILSLLCTRRSYT